MALRRAVQAIFVAGVCLGGCYRVPHVGPERDVVYTIDELVQAVGDRVADVQTLSAQGGTIRRGILPGRADIMIHRDYGFRIQIKNPINGDTLFLVVLNTVEESEDEGRFILVNWQKKTGVQGVLEDALTRAIPDADVTSDELSPMKLFFPTIIMRDGLESHMAFDGNAYTAGFWTPQGVQVAEMLVDAWSLTPISASVYRDGREALRFEWDDLEWDARTQVVRPCGVRIHLIDRDISVRLSVPRAKINGRISPAAFRLRIPPGIEVKDLGAEEESGSDDS